MKRSRGVSTQLATGVGFLLKKNKVDVIWGEATITKVGEIAVKAATKSALGKPPIPAPKGALGPGTYTAKHIIVATGARPRVLPGIEPDGKLIWTYYEAMVPADHAEVAARHGLGRDRRRVRLFLPHHGRRGDDRRGAAADPAGRGCRDRRPRPQALREDGHQDPDRRQGDRGREGRRLDHGHDRRRQGRHLEDHRRPADLGRRRRRQHREPRAREARRQDRARRRGDRRQGRDQRAGHLRHRRRRRAADAGPQGRARGRRSASRPSRACTPTRSTAP